MKKSFRKQSKKNSKVPIITSIRKSQKTINKKYKIKLKNQFNLELKKKLSVNLLKKSNNQYLLYLFFNIKLYKYGLGSWNTNPLCMIFFYF